MYISVTTDTLKYALCKDLQFIFKVKTRMHKSVEELTGKTVLLFA
jgi:hypothetical protein